LSFNFRFAVVVNTDKSVLHTPHSPLTFRRPHLDKGIEKTHNSAHSITNSGRFVLTKPTSRFDFDQATQMTKQLVNQMPQWLQLPFIRSWVFWAMITFGISGGLVYLALGLLLNPKAVPNCPEMFVPMSSPSLRVYCGQLAASKQTLGDLVSALNLVKDIAPSDPTRSYVDSNVQRWSLDILRLAESTYQEGNFEEAVNAVKQVPNNVPAYKIVNKRLKQWEETWGEGQQIDKEARALLNSSKWVNAYQVAVKLTRLNNRYWSMTKYQELADLVQIAKADSARLEDAHQLLKSSNIKDWRKAIEMAEKTNKSSFAYAESRTIVTEAGKKMLALAQTELDRNNWQKAIEIANQITETPEIKIAIQDLINVAQAQSHAVKGSVSELETAISLLQSIKPDSPQYLKSQKLMSGWQLEVQDVATLQRAESYALADTVADLKAAIAEAQKIPATNPRGKEAAKSISEWNKRIETVEDTPYLSAADQYAASGNPTALRTAIAQLQMIKPGRALYPQAKQKIQDWTAQIQRAEDEPILANADSFARSGNLRAAVQEARKIPGGRALSAQAKERIQDWQAQLQAEQNLGAAQQLAATGTPEALLGAIQAAARIPRSSSLRSQARVAMDNWSNQMMEVAQSTATTDIRRAIAIAKAIPSSTAAYASAQIAIQQWEQQLNPRPTEPTGDNSDSILPNYN
jgi:ubiquitin-protein ligase